ncbi:heavy metal translocating P-type ATPase [Enterovirga rhinocerotis]|uniref:Cu2+-exporting ATPase n=1 Tax=Enterovirga rhinocerotis TaxID=1339210 RepID=A0A4R7C668_9HYPH|nr:heavy metal translocating P-type ATPase [Enterovirga rhinocerotis]TDR94070.1 Cu2+-exporting ATPase [Enterovirga rhinocerotis]
MTCCAASLAIAAQGSDLASRPREELLLASREIGPDLRQSDLSVPSIHCGACIQRIERVLGALPGVEHARVNLSTRRVSVRWRGEAPPPLIETLAADGYAAHLDDGTDEPKDRTLGQLIRALAVSGFAASNIMIFSVSIWSGAEPETRDLFHWLSGLIALPALAYAGQVFFRSAWSALRHGRTNMDVPISIGVLLAFGMSVYETAHGGPHAYFDASVSLLFFLLIGRTLDHVMRERARVAVKGLRGLASRGALVLEADGSRSYRPLPELEPGMTILLAAGERVPVDSLVLDGRSDLDASLVSGESAPRDVVPGTRLEAGTLNLTGPLVVRAEASAGDSFLAEMLRLMEAAEAGRSHYQRIAERVSRLYAPVVHLAAALTCLGWVLATGDWHRAITIAIAVLIITCPCALGLAVPMVQVVAARRLFEAGIMVKDGGALERLAEIDAVVLDKTGTLTRGEPRLVAGEAVDEAALGIAAAIAAHSRHPYSQAVSEAARARLGPVPPVAPGDVSDHPGSGLEARLDGALWRLGRADWALAEDAPGRGSDGVVLARDGRLVATFRFEDRLREDARAAVSAMTANGLSAEILSGDAEPPVRQVAQALGLPWRARMVPSGKVAHIAERAREGRRVLMVGDGLNDAPALAAAHASMAPANAADIGRNAADLVFLRESLLAVPQALSVAREARTLVRENLFIAIGYNAIAVPIAVLGYVTPLVAAIAMSLSSIIVVANALRLSGRTMPVRREPAAPAPTLSSQVA